MTKFQVGLAVLALLQAAAVLAADFSAAQVEAAREGLQQALDQAVAKSVAGAEEVDMPPYIQQAVRTVALVQVETVKQANHVKLLGLQTLSRDGAFGVDPIVAGKAANFTLPLKLDKPQLTGVFTRKLNGVGPEGNFTTTIGVLRLEAEGTATVAADGVCAFNFTSVKDVEVNEVDSTVEGASLLNSLLASKVTKAVNERKLGVGAPASEIVLAKLQAAGGDCTASVRDRLKTVPSAPPATAAA